MKKFKRILYPIYVIISLWLIYFSIDSLMHMEETLAWFNEKFSVQSGPFWIVFLLLALSILMIVEFITENIHIHQLKNDIPELEEEIQRLKAKLYDKSDGVDSSDDDEEY